MFQPKIVFFDIDDTLWIKCERRIPESEKRPFNQLIKWTFQHRKPISLVYEQAIFL